MVEQEPGRRIYGLLLRGDVLLVQGGKGVQRSSRAVESALHRLVNRLGQCHVAQRIVQMFQALRFLRLLQCERSLAFTFFRF